MTNPSPSRSRHGPPPIVEWHWSIPCILIPKKGIRVQQIAKNKKKLDGEKITYQVIEHHQRHTQRMSV